MKYSPDGSQEEKEPCGVISCKEELDQDLTSCGQLKATEVVFKLVKLKPYERLGAKKRPLPELRELSKRGVETVGGDHRHRHQREDSAAHHADWHRSHPQG